MIDNNVYFIFVIIILDISIFPSSNQLEYYLFIFILGDIFFSNIILIDIDIDR